MVIHLSSAAARSAKQEAAFKYADKLQQVAGSVRRALGADAEITRRSLVWRLRNTASELRQYAASARASSDPHSRLLAEYLRSYAEKLDPMTPPVTLELLTRWAEQLEAEAQREMNLY
jgi:hypothetical protein